MNELLTLAWLTDPWTYGIVLILALLLFGKRLPEVGRSLGRGIAEFKKGLHDVQDEFTKEDQHPTPPPPQNKLQPPQNPPTPQKLTSQESETAVPEVGPPPPPEGTATSLKE